MVAAASIATAAVGTALAEGNTPVAVAELRLQLQQLLIREGAGHTQTYTSGNGHLVLRRHSPFSLLQRPLPKGATRSMQTTSLTKIWLHRCRKIWHLKWDLNTSLRMAVATLLVAVKTVTATTKMAVAVTGTAMLQVVAAAEKGGRTQTKSTKSCMGIQSSSL